MQQHTPLVSKWVTQLPQFYVTLGKQYVRITRPILSTHVL